MSALPYLGHTTTGTAFAHIPVLSPFTPEVGTVCSARLGTILFNLISQSAYVNWNTLYVGFEVELRYAPVQQPHDVPLRRFCDCEL
jgi:hypothetical protein